MKKEEKAPKTRNHDSALKRWRFSAIAWPVLCVVLAGFIVCRPGRGGEERISDAMFTIIPLIFFAIGMSIRRRLLKECRDAVVFTTAVVVSEGRRIRTGKNDAFFPEFEFQAGETTYQVISPGGSGSCPVKEGEKVDLYYAPENPGVFFVPVMQRHDRRCVRLFCGIGIVFPLFGLFAPLLRTFVSSLP